ncbi:MAG TPA: GGDEF domain-containing protein [Solirubrobacterales bacterium]|nr:GGDEF domain-containing protein [Solirubrobacterales bacterium]
MKWRLPVGYFASNPEPYPGEDVGNAQRIGVVVWGLLVALLLVLVPLNPPTEGSAIGGWVLGAALTLAGIAAVFLFASGRIASWSALLLVSYLTAAGLGVMQWLCGGVGAPFRGLLLLPLLFVSVTQPPRKLAAFMGFVLLVLASPFVYDTWDLTRVESSGATLLIWCALAAGANVLMGGIRAQRHALQTAGETARQEARSDSLTSLYNRRAFDELLALEVKRADRLGIPLTVAMVDVENFKEINDQWGYADGDRCLRDVALTLNMAIREPDLCFRWGGDEFALILTGTRAEDTDPLAERLRSSVALRCRRPDGSPIQIRFAAAELGDQMAPEELVEMAGLALAAGAGRAATTRRFAPTPAERPRAGAAAAAKPPAGSPAERPAQAPPVRDRNTVWSPVVIGALLVAAVAAAILVVSGGNDNKKQVAGVTITAPGTAIPSSPAPAPAAPPKARPVRKVKHCEPIFGNGTPYPVVSSALPGGPRPADCAEAHSLVLAVLNSGATKVGDWRCVSRLRIGTLAVCRSGRRVVFARV